MSHRQLTIKEIRVRSVMAPFKRPLATKVGRFEQWPLMLIDLFTREGVTGRSYLAPYLRRAPAYITPVIMDLAQALAGLPLAPSDMHQAGCRALGPLLGKQGITLMAVAGLDMAAWDALAKAAGLPLAEHLGGTLGPVPAYNSNGLGLMPAQAAAKEAVELLAEGGFKGVKFRVGRDTLGQDLEAIQAVRDACGRDTLLFFDFNQGLDRAEAMKRCQALDQVGGVWLEEPLPYDDLAGHAQLAEQCTTPIMIGENFYGPTAMREALAAKACDLVMPDLMRIGGVTGWLRAAGLAQTWGVQMSSHLYPEISSHLMRVTPTAHWLEWQDWAEPILAEPFKVENGFIIPPDKPGNGLEWDEEAVARYRYEP